MSSRSMSSRSTRPPTTPRPKRRAYRVGRGKPPTHARFQKGQSGNPGGRPAGMTAERAKALALEEAYRVVTVKVGGAKVALPAIQAVLRSQMALAAGGNGPAQRAVIKTVQALEAEVAEEVAVEAARNLAAGKVNADAVRRIAYLLNLGGYRTNEDGQWVDKDGKLPTGDPPPAYGGPAPTVPGSPPGDTEPR